MTAAQRDFKDRLYAQYARIGKAVGSPHRFEMLDCSLRASARLTRWPWRSGSRWQTPRNTSSRYGRPPWSTAARMDCSCTTGSPIPQCSSCVRTIRNVADDGWRISTPRATTLRRPIPARPGRDAGSARTRPLERRGHSRRPSRQRIPRRTYCRCHLCSDRRVPEPSSVSANRQGIRGVLPWPLLRLCRPCRRTAAEDWPTCPTIDRRVPRMACGGFPVALGDAPARQPRRQSRARPARHGDHRRSPWQHEGNVTRMGAVRSEWR